MKKCSLTIDRKQFNFNIKDGKFYTGKNILLFNRKKDPFRFIDKNIQKDGYINLKIMNEDQYVMLIKNIQIILTSIMQKINIKHPNDLPLEDYHKWVSSDKHNDLIKKTRSLGFNDFGVNLDNIIYNIESHLKIKLKKKLPHIDKDIIQLRINRPGSLDINPPHRDSYFPAYKSVINIWIPLINCTNLTSLGVMPGSHLIKENEIKISDGGTYSLNGNKYNVPCIIDTINGMNFIRPNPKKTESLIFTSSLIHGVAFNTSKKTRMSLELRLDEV